MIRLYDYELSADCYKVRLLASILKLDITRAPVDFYPGRAHEAAEFLTINPLGTLPVLDDDGLVLRDARAILVYLASRYDANSRWYPRADAAMLGRIGIWLAFAEDLTRTAGLARLHDGLFEPADIGACRAGAQRLFRALDEHLWFAEQEGQNWMCCPDHPTIADIACFPDIMLSEEGGISRLPYPAIRRWTDRVKRIPGFTVMPGIFEADPAPTSA